MTDDEIVSVMWNLIGGGLDTTTSLTSLALHHLDSRPDLRRRLIDDPHRCIGMHLARALFQVMVSEVLGRIPDYRVDRAGTRFYQGNPELFGVVEMPVTFSPGPATGVESPF